MEIWIFVAIEDINTLLIKKKKKKRQQHINGYSRLSNLHIISFLTLHQMDHQLEEHHLILGVVSCTPPCSSMGCTLDHSYFNTRDHLQFHYSQHVILDLPDRKYSLALSLINIPKLQDWCAWFLVKIKDQQTHEMLTKAYQTSVFLVESHWHSSTKK